MTTNQSRQILTLLGKNPDDPSGEEPLFIALQRCFDEKAADESRKEHDDHWTKPRPPAKSHGTHAASLATAKGGAK